MIIKHKIARVAQHRVFRAAFAALVLVVHLYAFSKFAKDTWNLPFNNAPKDAPVFVNPETDHGATYWNRLVVSRWDAGQYIGLGLMGFKRCPPDGDLRGVNLVPLNRTCNYVFYPGYAALGWAASLGGKYPIDYSLLAVSLLASFALVYVWTGPTMVRLLGLSGAWVSLIAFNAWTTGFSIVAIQSEPCTISFTFLAFIALERKRYFLGAVLAGAASGMRISGAATSLAYGLALLYDAYVNRPANLLAWAKRGLECLVSGWGLLTIMGYFYVRWKDPFLYMRAHSQAFGHSPSISHFFFPKSEWIYHSLSSVAHEIAWVFAAVIWFALAHRQSLRKATGSGQIYIYVQWGATLFISMFGSAEMAYIGMARYSLLLLGTFFAIGAFLKTRPVVLAIWLMASSWHYYNVSLCYYSQHGQEGGLNKCLADHEW
jgi:hypothetical protein